MNIDPSTPAREVLIRYLETSGVTQQKEAAAEMRKMEEEIKHLCMIVHQRDKLIDTLSFKKPSLTSRIALWFKKGK